MALSQAKAILQVEEETLSRAVVQEAFLRHFHKNDPDKGGSYYLQCKVFHAREALMTELGEEDYEEEEEEEEEEGPTQELEEGPQGAAKNDR